jgi:hypothetical protein
MKLQQLTHAELVRYYRLAYEHLARYSSIRACNRLFAIISEMNARGIYE